MKTAKEWYVKENAYYWPEEIPENSYAIAISLYSKTGPLAVPEEVHKWCDINIGTNNWGFKEYVSFKPFGYKPEHGAWSHIFPVFWFTKKENLDLFYSKYGS